MWGHQVSLQTHYLFKKVCFQSFWHFGIVGQKAWVFGLVLTGLCLELPAGQVPFLRPPGLGHCSRKVARVWSQICWQGLDSAEPSLLKENNLAFPGDIATWWPG